MTANPSANDHLLPLSLEESAQFSLEDDDELRHESDRQQRQDEIELDDADSGSDDLELLPPFTSTNNSTSTATKNAKRKLHKIFRCCSPHFVAPKCSIM
uniref:Uncharacterized protein n=1 Tax=Panagrolaimus sp. PS1159 TaxID=55785 RepID=A0AC35FP44_9BILA